MTVTTPVSRMAPAFSSLRFEKHPDGKQTLTLTVDENKLEWGDVYAYSNFKGETYETCTKVNRMPCEQLVNFVKKMGKNHAASSEGGFRASSFLKALDALPVIPAEKLEIFKTVYTANSIGYEPSKKRNGDERITYTMNA